MSKPRERDLGMPLTAVTLLYRHGYARQHLDGGTQTETFPSFDPSSLLEETGHILEDELEGRTVRLSDLATSLRGNRREYGGCVVPGHGC